MIVYETEKISQRKSAIIAGLSIIVMALCAGFSFGFIHSKLVVNGDAAVTMNNISQCIALFRAEIFGWLVILVLDILIAWALYIFLKQVDNSLSLLASWIRIVYSTILGTAISCLLCVTLFASGEHSLTSTYADQIMLYFNAFDKIWSFGLILFGFHLSIIAYLILKSDFMPKLLGILLVIAAFGYILIHIMHSFLPQYENITVILEKILSLPMTIGELSLGIWLLIKGGKIQK